MSETDLVLAVGRYHDREAALLDLRDLTNPGPLRELIAGTAILNRGARHSSLEQEGGGSLGYWIGTGAAGGLAVGAMVGQPLMGTLGAAFAGGFWGRAAREREVRQLVRLVELDVPPGSTGLLAVVPEPFLAEVRSAMTRAAHTTGRLLDDEQSRKAARGLVRGNPTATEALGG